MSIGKLYSFAQIAYDLDNFELTEPLVPNSRKIL